MGIGKAVADGFLWSVGFIAVASIVKQPMMQVQNFIGGAGKGGQ